MDSTGERQVRSSSERRRRIGTDWLCALASCALDSRVLEFSSHSINCGFLCSTLCSDTFTLPRDRRATETAACYSLYFFHSPRLVPPTQPPLFLSSKMLGISSNFRPQLDRRLASSWWTVLHQDRTLPRVHFYHAGRHPSLSSLRLPRRMFQEYCCDNKCSEYDCQPLTSKFRRCNPPDADIAERVVAVVASLPRNTNIFPELPKLKLFQSSFYISPANSLIQPETVGISM